MGARRDNRNLRLIDGEIAGCVQGTVRGVKVAPVPPKHFSRVPLILMGGCVVAKRGYRKVGWRPDGFR